MKKPQAGFTLVEILIAVAVLGVLILVSFVTISFVSRVYFKGNARTQTQAATRRIVDDLKQSIQASSSAPRPLGWTWAQTATPSNNNANNIWQAYCIGGAKYSYKLNVQLFENPEGPNRSNQVFIRSDGCTDDTALPENNPVELLDNQMRIIDFDITTSSGLSTISLKLAFGGNANTEAVDFDVFRCEEEKDSNDQGTGVCQTKSHEFKYTDSQTNSEVTINLESPQVIGCDNPDKVCAFHELNVQVFRRLNYLNH